MANQYVNRVVLADGTTLIDISSDTVAADKMLSGYTAHGADGAPVTGTWSLQNNVFTVGALWATEDITKNPATELGFGTWTKVSPIEATWAEMAMDAPTIYVWKRTA